MISLLFRLMLSKKYVLALLILSFVLGGAYLFTAEITGSVVDEGKVGASDIIIDSLDCDTNISDCNAAWNDNEIYCLDADVDNSFADGCMLFDGSVDNITLWCAGRYIDGDGTLPPIGIKILNTSVECRNITIVDCTVKQFGKGIYVGDLDYHINITQSNISYNRVGIEVNSSTVNIINNTIQNNSGYGINLSRLTDSIIENNTFSKQGNVQLYLFNHHDAEISHNTFELGAESAIQIFAAQDNTFTNNTVDESHWYSFYSADDVGSVASTGNTITNLTTTVDDTTIVSFTYSGANVTVNASYTPAPPAGNLSLGDMAINISAPPGAGAGEHVYLNFSYIASDISLHNVKESTVKIWAYDESAGTWSVVTGSSVDTTARRVYGNCTSLVARGTIFAPLGRACLDSDSDGYDDCNATEPGDTDGLVEDCDDSSGAVSPSALEICNSIDDDCDGEIDESNICTKNPGEDGGGSVPPDDNDSKEPPVIIPPIPCGDKGGLCCKDCEKTGVLLSGLDCPAETKCCKKCVVKLTCTKADYRCCEKIKVVTKDSSSYDATCYGDYVCGVTCLVDAPPEADLTGADGKTTSTSLITGKTAVGGIPTAYFIVAQVLLGLLAGFCFLIYKLAAK